MENQSSISASIYNSFQYYVQTQTLNTGPTEGLSSWWLNNRTSNSNTIMTIIQPTLAGQSCCVHRTVSAGEDSEHRMALCQSNTGRLLFLCSTGRLWHRTAVTLSPPAPVVVKNTPLHLRFVSRLIRWYKLLYNHGSCQWERAIFDPHSSETPGPIFMKLEIYNYFTDTTPHAKFQGPMSTWVV